MMAQIGGHNFFLSADEQKRLRDDTLEKIKRDAEQVISWAEKIDDSFDQENFSSGHRSSMWSSFDTNLKYLLEHLDFYCAVRSHYVNGPLRDAFQRDDRGEVIK